MWIVFRTASILWFIYFVVISSFTASFYSQNEGVILLRISFAVLLFLSCVAVYFFYLASLRERRRKINIKLRKSLLSYFKSFEYNVSLVDFAEQNGVKVRDAQKFIDMLIEHYNGKLDINEQGMIVYLSNYISAQVKKKGKKKRK